MVIEKTFTIKSLPPTGTEEALEKISASARRPVSADEVYIGRAELANDRTDKSGERFPLAYLQRFAETIVGAPVLEAHDKSRSGVGRWFDAVVEKVIPGEARLITDFYLDARSDLARRVDLGIAKEVSIGALVPRGALVCDLCGKGYETDCTHTVLKQYGERICTLTYGGDVSRVRAVEGSFVGVGSQYGAQVLRAKVWAPGGSVIVNEEQPADGLPSEKAEDRMEKAELELRVKVLEDENLVLKSATQETKALAEAGKAYHADLKARVLGKMSALEEKVDPEVDLFAGASLDVLKAWDARLSARLDEKFPPTPVSKPLDHGAVVAPRQEAAPPAPPAKHSPFAALRGGPS